MQQLGRLTKLAALVCCGVACAVNASRAQGASANEILDLTGYKLTFDDEFNSLSASAGSLGPASPLSTVWQTQFFWGDRYLPANGEQQYYSDTTTGTNPFAVSNGALEITAAPGSNPGGQPYTSGMLQSEHSFAQTYGYFEMRAQLPQGPGMWPAFWLLPANGGTGEIDIMEAFGAPNQNAEGGARKIHWALHMPNHEAGAWATVPSDMYAGYHRYGLAWEPHTIAWYFDGRKIAEVPTPADLNTPMYLIVNLAVGGKWVGPANRESARMNIDYVRAYTKAPDAIPIRWQAISPPDGADTTASGVISTNSALVRPHGN